MRIGLFADAHTSAAPLDAVTRALERFRDCDMVMNLGDLYGYSGDEAESAKAGARFEALLKASPAPVCHVPGNHDYDAPHACLPAFVQNAKGGHVVLSAHWTHIILDSCFTPDGASFMDAPHVWNECCLPQEQLAFLSAELRRCENAIVYVHSPIALPEHPDADIRNYIAKHSEEARGIIERSGVVRLVVQGHFHAGGQIILGGIPYITQTALEFGGQAHAGLLTLETRHARYEPIDPYEACAPC